jgi:hypothetical protein
MLEAGAECSDFEKVSLAASSGCVAHDKLGDSRPRCMLLRYVFHTNRGGGMAQASSPEIAPNRHD